jgi:HPt (histidine-containing phosphotransfer) domain-containing protein
MGDRALLVEMAELWLADSAQQLTLIQTGLASGDRTIVQRAAHALKGSVGTFQASAAQEAAEHLELSAQDGNLVEMQKASKTLLTQVELVKQDLLELSRHTSAGFKPPS